MTRRVIRIPPRVRHAVNPCLFLFGNLDGRIEVAQEGSECIGALDPRQVSAMIEDRALRGREASSYMFGARSVDVVIAVNNQHWRNQP